MYETMRELDNSNSNLESVIINEKAVKNVPIDPEAGIKTPPVYKQDGCHESLPLIRLTEQAYTKIEKMLAK